MDTLVKSDIFFFIASIAVVVWTLGMLIVGYYLVRIVRKTEILIAKVESNIDQTSDEMKGFVSDLRESFIFKLLLKNKTKNGKQK